MRVRLTSINGGDNIFEGIAIDPPEIGKQFVLLLPAQGKVAITHAVVKLGFDNFETDTGARYCWARFVGTA